jgi:hypothetical protein
MCVLHSCIENPGNFRAFVWTCQSDRGFSYVGGIELVINISAIDFNMNFIKFPRFEKKQFEFNSNMNDINSNNNNLKWNLKFETTIYNKRW